MTRKYSDLSLKNLNTFGIEARCKQLYEFVSVADLAFIFQDKDFDGENWYVLGGGSNVIFTKDYEGAILHAVEGGIKIVSDEDDSVVVRAGAGVEWDALVEWAVSHDLWGLENLSYIPGTVGASPVQNIGAYGTEAGDVIESVETFSVPNRGILRINGAHCGFGYRASIFKTALRGKAIITSVDFRLSRLPRPRLGYGDLNTEVENSGGATLRNIRNAVTKIRRSKLPEPSEMGNAGSFFKNPVIPAEIGEQMKKEHPSMPLYPAQDISCSKLAAGWLIDQCGWKGRSLGRVAVHEKQALVLVNLGGATGADVLELAGRIIGDVKRVFGVELETEVNIL